MAKIKMSVSKKEEQEAKEEEAKELAEKVAKDVAEKAKPKPKPKKKAAPKPKAKDSDEGPKYDSDRNYAKIALVRVSVGDDDERSMEDWTKAIAKDLSKHKNVTVLTKHYLVDGAQVAAHKVDG